MVVALEDEYLLVADGVVALLVVEIEEGGDLWEFISYVLQQSIDH